VLVPSSADDGVILAVNYFIAAPVSDSLKCSLITHVTHESCFPNMMKNVQHCHRNALMLDFFICFARISECVRYKHSFTVNNTCLWKCIYSYCLMYVECKYTESRDGSIVKEGVRRT